MCIMEAVDNGRDIQDIMIDSNIRPEVEPSEGFYFPVIHLDGCRRKYDSDSLYRPLSRNLSQKLNLYLTMPLPTEEKATCRYGLM